MEAIDRSRIVLFGDFHSHKQCQRAFLRILRMYTNRPDHAPMIVLLEMFKSKDQKYIDAWYQGKMTDQDFLEAVNYEETWGFPWTNYRPILEFCKYHNIKLLGVNTARAGKDTLAVRDAHASKIIHKTLDQTSNIKVFCMMGEFHLADRHLPSAIASQNNSDRAREPLRVFTNLDKYFFSLDPTKIHHRDEYLSLSPGIFCIMNSPPWIKWHSQSLWEEIKRIGPVKYLEDAIAPDDVESDLASWDDDDDDLYTDDTLDLDFHLVHLQRQLAQFFRIDASAEVFERFHIVHGSLDEEIAHLPEAARNSILSRASIDGFAVDISGRCVYMPEVSINNMASASGQMLFGSLCNLSEQLEDGDSFFVSQCLKFAFGFIANKILNPRLPLHTLKQIESYVQTSRGRRLIGSMRQRRLIAQETLNLYHWIHDSWSAKVRTSSAQKFRPIPTAFLKLDATSSSELARSLGQLIAEPICRNLIRGRIDTTDIKRWLMKDCSQSKNAKETLTAMIMLPRG